jgi:hypothetical protein
MNQNQTESKPTDAEQESGKGLDGTPCSLFHVTTGRKANLHELELVGFMSPHFTIPVKPKVKRKSKIVQRIEDAGYHIEKTGQEWHVWHKDDHSVVAIYDRLRDIPSFPPCV